jgi:hypothetical protein
LTDHEIRAIAVRIRRAMADPMPGDPEDDILSQRHELSPEDEDRVEAALVALRALRVADREDTTRAERDVSRARPGRP